MIKQILIIGLIIFLIINTTGCMDGSNKFVGTWKDEVGDTIIFYSDGTFTSEEKEDYFVTGTYEVSDTELILTYQGRSIIYRYTFSNNDHTCRLTSDAIDHTKFLYKQ